MKKSVWAFTIGGLLIAGHLFAGDGDLLVNGRIGVGTTSPVQDLEVLSNHSGTRGMTIHQVSDNGWAGQSYFKKDRAGKAVINGDYVGTNKASVYDGSAYLATAGYGYKVNGTVSVGSVPTDLYFYTGSVDSSDPYGNGLVKMIVNSSGSVGIGTTDPAGYKLYVNGSMQASSYAGSDLRWKKNIQPITNAMSLVEGLKGVRFDWRTEEFKDKDFDKNRQVGLIAQDVEKVLPEIVKTGTDGYKAVSYERLTAVLVEAVKEQQKQIQELRREIASLKAK